MPLLDTQLKTDDLSVGTARPLELGGRQVGLFHTAEGYFAIDNVCPHRGAPLHEGFVADGCVTCPWHQWHFQLQDGVCRNIPGARVDSFSVEQRDGTLWINLPTSEPA